MPFRQTPLPKWGRYNLDLAVTARIILMKEMHNQAKREAFVWVPTDQALKDLAKTRPKFLQCFHGPVFQDAALKTGATFCDLYAVASDNKVVYVGTILDRKQTKANWKWLLGNAESHEAKELKLSGMMSVVRYRIRCYIPSLHSRLSKRAMEQGIKLFLRTYVPELSRVRIKWLSKKEQDSMEAFIRQEADERAWPQTRQEKREADFQDRQDRIGRKL